MMLKRIGNDQMVQVPIQNTGWDIVLQLMHALDHPQKQQHSGHLLGMPQLNTGHQQLILLPQPWLCKESEATLQNANTDMCRKERKK